MKKVTWMHGGGTTKIHYHVVMLWKKQNKKGMWSHSAILTEINLNDKTITIQTNSSLSSSTWTDNKVNIPQNKLNIEYKLFDHDEHFDKCIKNKILRDLYMLFKCKMPARNKSAPLSRKILPFGKYYTGNNDLPGPAPRVSP